MKYEIGQEVIMTENANYNYSYTKQGFKGIIQKIYIEEHMASIYFPEFGCSYPIRFDCFKSANRSLNELVTK